MTQKHAGKISENGTNPTKRPDPEVRSMQKPPVLLIHGTGKP